MGSPPPPPPPASPAPGATVLVIEDDADLLSLLERLLAAQGMSVRTATDGESGLALALAVEPDLVILDVGLPKRNGVDVVRELRGRQFRAPMLMLTARGAVSDKVVGLEAGADDYLPKPFELPELLARVRALLRRAAMSPGAPIHVRDLTLDPVTRHVTRKGRRISLTQKEFALLEFLMRHPGQPLTRQMITEQVWNQGTDPTNNVVDVYINYLRKKLERARGEPLIQTIRGVGYMLSD